MLLNVKLDHINFYLLHYVDGMVLFSDMGHTNIKNTNLRFAKNLFKTDIIVH